jgi:FAD/FMN-containing dehydrogenase
MKFHEKVTADGEEKTCSAEENENLFWAVRGGGGNFGVVTEFKVKLHKLPETVHMVQRVG